MTQKIWKSARFWLKYTHVAKVLQNSIEKMTNFNWK